MKNKIVLVIVLLLSFANVYASQMKKICVSQVVKHPALDITYKGIVDGLKARGYIEKKNIIIEYEQAQGNIVLASQISQKFIAREPDILVGIGTTTTQSLVNISKGKIPVVFASVTDPLEAQITKDLKNNNNQVTGVSNFVEIAPQIEFIKKIIPNIQKLGIIYNPGEANSVKLLQGIYTVGEKLKLEIVTSTANNSSEVPMATKFLVGRADAIFITNDNTALSAFSAISKIGLQQNIPVFVSDVDIADQGALASLGPNQYIIGKQAGEQIADILDGKNAGQIPVQFPQALDIYLNKKTAQKLKIEFNKILTAKATKIIE